MKAAYLIESVKLGSKILLVESVEVARRIWEMDLRYPIYFFRELDLLKRIKNLEDVHKCKEIFAGCEIISFTEEAQREADQTVDGSYEADLFSHTE